jgi:hypothetical protein
VAGTDLDCDDGIDCTDDSCDNSVTDGCVNTANDSLCDDDLYCTGEEYCDPSTGSGADRCLHRNEPSCDDSIDCTNDSCSSVTDGCVHDPDNTLCSFGDLCDSSSGCYTPPECEADGDCDDGAWCTGDETCSSGGDCVAGTNVDCDDGLDCTDDRCDNDLVDCENTPNDDFCDDDNYCNGAETCDPTATSGDGCVSGTAPDECLLECTDLSPAQGSTGIDQVLTFTGDYIIDGTRARLEPASGDAINLGLVTVDADGLGGTIAVSALTADPGEYDVVLYSAYATPTCGSIVFLEELSCGEVTPGTLSATRDETLTLEGARIEAGADVILTDLDTGDEYTVGTATADASSGTATVVVSADSLGSAVYAVRVVNTDGEEANCLNSVRVTNRPPPEVTDVVPYLVWQGDSDDDVLSDESVTIVGDGFLVTPSVTWVSVDDPSATFDATEVVWTSSGEITAVCPVETLDMPVGEYHVMVTNPDGLSAYWIDSATADRGVFEVVADPPPRILEIDPVRGPAASDWQITITGENLDATAEAYMVDTDGTLLALQEDSFDPDTGELVVTIPGGTLASGTRYPVRVVNDDGRYDDYYVYTASTSADAHLQGNFETVTSSTLVTGRERLDLVWGYDAFGSSYLYAAGGIDASDTVLDDVEMAGLSLFGEPTTFAQTMQYGDSSTPRVVNRMTTPRHGLAVVRVGRWLYAMGGAEDVTTTDTCVTGLDTVERAQIMGYETMPASHIPILHGGSGLAFGTWYYRVSEIGPWGESLASREVQARNTNGRVEVCWTSRTDEASPSFNIYRSVAADGRSGTTRLLAAEVTGNCFTDTGRGDYQPAPGRLRSSLTTGGSLAVGYWTYRVTAVVDGLETLAGYREHVEVTDLTNDAVSLRWDPVPNATYNLYRTEAVAADATGAEVTYQLATGLTTNSYTDNGGSVTVSAEAPDGIAPLPPGSLTAWEELSDTPLTVPREGPDGIPMVVPSMEDDDGEGDRTFIYLAGGRPHNFGTPAAGECTATDTYHDTIERAEVGADGTLSDWGQETEVMNSPRAFLVLLTTLGRNEAVFPPDPEDPGCPDADGDGYASDSCCTPVPSAGIECDCDDTDPTIYPGAEEICGDGIDQDCDGTDPDCICTPPDVDGDGHDSIECGGDDCDDADGTVYPGADDPCEDGIDQDCDGVDPSCACSDPDEDDDGFNRIECGGDDCDDTDSTVHPGAREVFCDGVDQDCDGVDSCWGDSIIDETIYLIVSHGDDVFNSGGSGNSGRDDFEASRVFAPDGDISAWTVQDTTTSGNFHGHGALLYFDTVFFFSGVKTEDLGEEPSPRTSAGGRRPLLIDATPISTDPWVPSVAVLENDTQSSSTGFAETRCYYGMARANTRLFVVGGNDGAGPIDSVEYHDE